MPQTLRTSMLCGLRIKVPHNKFKTGMMGENAKI